jgi:vacuolar protein sorting-associated protein 13A/C
VGGLKGITGLVVKPVSGIFDATTKTFEGIKNTPSYFQNLGEEPKMKVKRRPRVFYGYNREFRAFDENLSNCSKYIAEKDEEKFENLSWYGAYHLVTPDKHKVNPVLLGISYII